MRLPGSKTAAKDHITLQEVLDAEHAALGIDVHDQPRSALCISGGGIRSATFALGALQALAEKGLLHQFDYLSTVSGGGYIGGWLTAWIKREGDPLSVEEHLAPSRIPEARPDRRVIGRGRIVDEEPEPIHHLRSYSNYLTPRPG